MIKNIALVFLGGGAGSTLRFLLSSWLNQYFPWAAGTFSANILGSLLIGLLMGWFMKWPHMEADLRLLLAIGFCGGFTTFSAFALEQVNMIKNGATLHALVYMASSMALGVAAVFLGLWLSRH
jgi:CrcB protein